MLGQDYELQKVTGEMYDYTVIEAHYDEEDRQEGEVAEYQAWEAEDTDWALVVEEGTPDEVIVEIEAQSNFTTIVTTDEAEAEKVKEVDMDVRERVAFYIEDPPENRFQDVPREAAIDMMDRRNLWDEANVYRESWYYPESDEVVVEFSRQGTHKSVSRLADMDDMDREIMAGEYSLGEDDDELREQIESRAEELAQDTYYSDREAQGIVIREMGLKNQRGAEIMDEQRTHVNQWITRAKRKYEKVERSYEEVDPDIFEDRRGQHWQDKTDG